MINVQHIRYLQTQLCPYSLACDNLQADLPPLISRSDLPDHTSLFAHNWNLGNTFHTIELPHVSVLVWAVPLEQMPISQIAESLLGERPFTTNKLSRSGYLGAFRGAQPNLLTHKACARLSSDLKGFLTTNNEIKPWLLYGQDTICWLDPAEVRARMDPLHHSLSSPPSLNTHTYLDAVAASSSELSKGGGLV